MNPTKEQQLEALDREIYELRKLTDDHTYTDEARGQYSRDAITLQHIRDSLPALLADAEAFRGMKARGPAAWIGKSSRSREDGDYRQLLQDYSASGGYGISAEYAADEGFSPLYALPDTKEGGQ